MATYKTLTGRRTFVQPDGTVQDGGRVYRTRLCRWSLMNRAHFSWLTQEYHQAGYRQGYEAALREAQQMIAGKAKL